MSLPANVLVSAVMIENETCAPVMISVQKGMEQVIELAIRDCLEKRLKEGKIQCGQPAKHPQVDRILEELCNHGAGSR